jgi:hypothetical protein
MHQENTRSRPVKSINVVPVDQERADDVWKNSIAFGGLRIQLYVLVSECACVINVLGSDNQEVCNWQEQFVVKIRREKRVHIRWVCSLRAFASKRLAGHFGGCVARVLTRAADLAESNPLIAEALARTQRETLLCTF